MTDAQKRVLAELLGGMWHDAKDGTGRGGTLQLLEAKGLLIRSWHAGTQWITLTPYGRELAEQITKEME
jgi:DNA-binding PadR family transcriptional regulator